MIRRACFTTGRDGLGFTLTAIGSPRSPGLLMPCTFEGHRVPALPLVRPFAGCSRCFAPAFAFDDRAGIPKPIIPDGWAGSPRPAIFVKAPGSHVSGYYGLC